MVVKINTEHIAAIIAAAEVGDRKGGAAVER